MKKMFTLIGALGIFGLLNAQTTHNVSVTSNQYSPSTLTIEVGDEVVWTNTQGSHNVNGTTTTFPDNPESFGNNVGSGWTFSHTFTIAGEYDYQCDPHVGFNMFGSITVIEAPATTPPNDTCQGAVPFAAALGTTTSTTGDGTGATVDGPTWPAAQVWEAFTIDACADVVIDFCGSDPYAAALYVNIYNACPTDSSDALEDGVVTDVECAPGDTALQVTFTGLEAGTYYYPIVADTAFGGFEAYTMNVTPSECEVIDPEVEGESFESGVFPPYCWTQADEDGDGQSWFAYGADPYAGDSSAATASWNGTPLTPDNWLITPQLELGTGEELRFYVAAQDPDWSLENYSVYISTTGNAVADFDTELWTETLASTDWAERTLDLSAYDGQTVYLAFRHHDVTDQFVMKIDNVVLPGTEIDCATSVSELENEVRLNVYPNPNNGDFSIMNEGMAGNFLIEMMDVTGKSVHSQRIQLNSAQRTDINTTDVTPGVYLLKLTNTDENYFRTIRMVVR